MVVSYKNFWSLNVDEAVVSGILRNYFRKNAEVLMPMNAQMKDVDLIVANLKNNIFCTIQVKGSRAYEPDKQEKEMFGEGSTGWFFLDKNVIRRCEADYFIFLIYVIVQDKNKGRRYIEPHTITIKPKVLWNLCKKKKILHKRYSFYFWINPKKKSALDYRDMDKKGVIKLDKYLDKRGLDQIRSHLGIRE